MSDFNGPLAGNEYDPTSLAQRRAIEDTCDAADARKALAEPGERVDAETIHEELATWDAASDEDYEKVRRELLPEYTNGEPFEVPSGSRWPGKGDHVRGDRYTEVVQRLYHDIAWMRGLILKALVLGAVFGAIVTWGIMR